jgi:diaminopimelate epimerase
MTGPAEPVFDGVLAPPPASVVEPAITPESSQPSQPSRPAQPEDISCVTDCVEGCQRPDNCPSAEARRRVEELLESRSLDDLVALAAQSLETRTQARFSRDRAGSDRAAE